METGQLIFFSVVGVCIGIAFVLNEKFKIKNPDCLPYKWGFFSATTSAFLGIAFALSPQIGATPDGPIWLGAVLAIGIGYLVYKRTKLGWGLWYLSQFITIAYNGLNTANFGSIIIMVLTLVYLKKRWHEFALYPGYQPAIDPNER